MAISTGTVSCVQVADDYCFFAVRESATAAPEAFVLWFFTTEATAHVRILQSIEVSMLRDAQSNGLPVTVVHGDTSAQVLSLQLGTLDMTVRLAVVIIQGATANVERDLANANSLYWERALGWIDLVGVVTVDRPHLLTLDQDDCFGGAAHVVSAEEDELFDLGRDLGADIVGYYIQSDTGGFRGCAAHPPGRRGFWVADIATEWTFAHELTHVVGSNPHVGDSDNLMFGGGTANITNLPPDLSDEQCNRICADPPGACDVIPSMIMQM